MKKKVNLALLIMATGLILLAAAFLITACGDLPEAEETFTITFNSNGGSTVAPQKGIAKDGFAKTPLPTPTWVGTPAPTTAGLYKDAATTGGTPSFQGWYKSLSDSSPFAPTTTPITENITLIAKWNNVPAQPTLISVGESATTPFTFAMAINFIKGASFSPSATESYTLVLSQAENDTNQNFISSGAIALDKNNLKLTITSNNAGQRTIKSTVTNGVFLTLGPAGDGTTTSNTTLTLKNVVLQGSGSEVPDSLVRVQNGATLILEAQAAVKGHKNSTTDTGGGEKGNGSAVCVVGATLTMKEQSVIEENASTKANGENRNYVGGVYTIANDKGVGPTLNIEGGQIINNTCINNNTKDVYATEGGTFKLSGNVKIDEITINADAATISPTNPTSATNQASVYTVIEVSNLGTEAAVKLSLRSTSAIGYVPTVWTGHEVLKAPSGGTLTEDIVKKFTLGDFKSRDGRQAISGYEIVNTGADIGKFVKTPTTP
jgi:hypothetical protein